MSVEPTMATSADFRKGYYAAMARAEQELIATGYVKAEPKWQDTLRNDGEYEYTTTSDCDGSNVRHWKRRPGRTYEDQPYSWEEV